MHSTDSLPTDSSDPAGKRRWSSVFQDMFLGIVRSRYIAYRLVKKDVRVAHSHSALGIFWDFVDPFVLGFIFFLLMKIGIVRSGIPTMPYAVFLIYGVLLYETFSESVLLSLGTINRAKGLLNQLKVPPEALILSVIFRVLFNSTFRIAIMLAFSLALYSTARDAGQSSFSPHGFILFLFFYPTIILTGLSIGIFLAPFNAIYSDVGRFVKVSLIPLRYSTPVFYIIPKNADNPILQSVLDVIHTFNALAYVLGNLRTLATTGSVTDLPQTILSLLLLFLLFLTGWVIFHLAIPVLADRA